MDLQRRKVWGDRLTWLLAAAATAVVVSQYVTRGGEVRLYLLVGWSAVMAFLVFFTELRIGRRQPAPGAHGFFAGVASYLGDEIVEDDGKRAGGWRGTVPGVLELGEDGVRWRAIRKQDGPTDLAVAWTDFWSWSLKGVIPLLWRASGYLVVRRERGREHIFHVSGVRRWQRALREAVIVGPTFSRPVWLPDEPAPAFPFALVDAIAQRGETDVVDAALTQASADVAAERVRPARVAAPPPPPPEPVPDVASEPAASNEPEREATEEPEREGTEEPEPVVAAEPEPVVAAEAEPVVALEEEPAPLLEPETRSVRDRPEFEPVIGLECHVELSTDSKVFCACPTTFGAPPNTQVCPVCTGQPGTLPVLNERAVEYALRIALALNCRPAAESLFHRKNYFYPDMPKNYQISQYDVPLATQGHLDVVVDGEVRRVRINRVHLEEDTGKTAHVGGSGRIREAQGAKVDYNRAGVPLVEVVSEADMRSPEEARAYIQELKSLLEWIDVSDVRMEEGSLRCDANVSVRPWGTDGFGVKVEVKNMNSIASVQQAIAFEVERLTELTREGQPIAQETRHFDESTGRTIAGRSKEYSADYRYFPDPDLLPLVPDGAWIERIRASLPELPAHVRGRFVRELGLREAVVATLTRSRGLAGAFEEAVVAYGGDPSRIARWYIGELAALANESDKGPHELIPAVHVAALQRLVDEGKVSDSLAKTTVLREVLASGKEPAHVVTDAGLTQTTASDLESIVDRILDDNPDVVARLKDGKMNAIEPLIGAVMRATNKTANAQQAREMILKRVGA